MNERDIRHEKAREAYSAPTYDVFSFETSDFMQMSGEPVALKGAYLGAKNDASTAVSAVFTGEDSDW